MTTSRCIRCGMYWCHSTGSQKFDVITKWCPLCVVIVFPVMGVTPLRKASA